MHLTTNTQDCTSGGGANDDCRKDKHKRKKKPQYGTTERGSWWTRTYEREYMPAVSLDNDSLKEFLRNYGLE